MAGVMGRGMIVARRWRRTLFRGGWVILLAALLELGANETLADVAQCPPSLELECSLSAFGTVGYAVSDNRAAFMRDIDSSGSLRADTLAGSQLDVRFNPEWGLTLQGVVKPSQDTDTGWSPSLSWAFLSYRPNNDWLIRVGKLRPTEYIQSQNMEVGFTYDQARLPQEFYSISTTYDLIGATAGKSWTMPDNAELMLEGYLGVQESYFPRYDRAANAVNYNKVEAQAAGVMLSRTTDDLHLRAGVHMSRVWRADGNKLFYNSFEPGSLPPNGTLYVPVDPHPDTHFYLYTLGIDWTVEDWRVTSEFALRNLPDLKTTGYSYGWYATVAHKFGVWTPYVTYARLQNIGNQFDLVRTLNATPVPLAARRPPFNLPATYHQSLADAIAIYDQSSVMVGTSYLLTPTTKLKAEYMRTEVGAGSALFYGIKPNSGVNIVTVSLSKMF